MSWFDKKTIGIPNTWLAIFIVVIVMFTSVGAGIRYRMGLKSGQEYLEDLVEVPESVTESETSMKSIITVDLTVSQNDWQAGSSASPTSPVYKLFQEKPTKSSAGLSLTVAGTDIEVKKANDGKVWIDMYGGSDFYIVEDALKASNDEITQIVKEDYDEDGKLDFLIELDLSQFLIGSQEFKPGYTLNVPLLDLDVTGLTSTNPADQSSIGSTETVINVEWTISAVTAEDGCYLTELYFTTNSTREGDDIQLEELYISGQWTWDGPTSFAGPIDKTYGDYSAYYVKASENNDYLASGSVMCYRDTGRADSLDLSLNARMTFDTDGEKIVLTLYAVFVDPTGAKTTVSDSVTLTE